MTLRACVFELLFSGIMIGWRYRLLRRQCPPPIGGAREFVSILTAAGRRFKRRPSARSPQNFKAFGRVIITAINRK